MDLAGQAEGQHGDERGYAMAALLVGLSIMAIMLTVVMPVWKQTTQREKEEELIFRGKQYVHAIAMFQRKFANAPPPNVDALVEQRFLRKKFKDPITGEDFVPIPVGQAVPGSTASGQRGATGSTTAGGRGQAATAPSATQSGGGRTGGPGISAGPTGQTAGGIQGVASKSKDQSIRLYNGRSHYNEWAFVYIPQVQAPGASAPGAGVPGQGGQRGQPGQPPGPLGPGGTPGQRGRGPGGPGGPNNPNSGRGNGGIGTFGSGGVTPVQPPSTPRGRF